MVDGAEKRNSWATKESGAASESLFPFDRQKVDDASRVGLDDRDEVSRAAGGSSLCFGLGLGLGCFWAWHLEHGHRNGANSRLPVTCQRPPYQPMGRDANASHNHDLGYSKEWHLLARYPYVFHIWTNATRGLSLSTSLWSLQLQYCTSIALVVDLYLPSSSISRPLLTLILIIWTIQASGCLGTSSLRVMSHATLP